MVFYRWQKRYVKINEHNHCIPRDFWLHGWAETVGDKNVYVPNKFSFGPSKEDEGRTKTLLAIEGGCLTSIMQHAILAKIARFSTKNAGNFEQISKILKKF